MDVETALAAAIEQGLDLVEVSPPYDPSGRTAVLAATIVREAILAIKGADKP